MKEAHSKFMLSENMNEYIWYCLSILQGYTEVVHVILKETILKSECLERVVHCEDLDGWTPLHAAAHWAQKEVNS